ncbi:MAG TPA: choice-of-anchor tandem repeat GloVer-containing protein [Bryobacteraceae bacterium]|nr:choice-of-anchor tandem repeat GloVer-containing protein [Bryobacteraceae bacterium]
MQRIVNAVDKLNWGRRACVGLVLCAMTAIALSAQTFTTLYSFDGTDGVNPSAALVQGADGDLYGTTYNGGANGYGTVFKISPSGMLETLYSFCSRSGCADGANPAAALVLAPNGNFYGTTELGGSAAPACGIGCGTVFKITPAGTLTTLYSFNFTDGAYPEAALVQAANGDFYGTTESGGTGSYCGGCGTLFKINPFGKLTTLYNFCSQSFCHDGYGTETALVPGSGGEFYGTTGAGGDYAGGTGYEITPSGTLTTLYSFCSRGGSLCTDGAGPSALVRATDGDFYGTTLGGGGNGQGTFFKMTPSGELTMLVSFVGDSGGSPDGLVQGTDGNLYGTTGLFYGNPGTVFQVTPAGTLTTLYAFCSHSGCPDGEDPLAGLVQATNGDFYGTTNSGGANNDGTIYSLSVGLGPFVKAVPQAGLVGQVVRILGTGLTGATSVSFNGTAAEFSVVAASEITATVPGGATTGKIQVTTPGGTLLSGGPFLVEP